MAQFEHLISRYLDGDLTSAEQEELQQLLMGSPDARAHLHDLQAVAHAARRTPLMHRPEPELEARLFQRLASEGLTGTPYQPAVVAAKGFALRTWHMLTAGAIATVLLWFSIARFTNESPSASEPPSAVAAATQPRTGAAPQTNPSADGAGRTGTLVGGGTTVRSGDAGTADANTASDRSGVVGSVTRESRTQGDDNAPRIRTRSVTPVRHAAERNERASTPSANNVMPAGIGADEATSSTLPTAIDRVQPRVLEFVVEPSTESRATKGGIAFGYLPEPSESSGLPLAASLRGGMATLANTDLAVREMDMKLGLRLGTGHQLSLVAGTGPAMVSRNASEQIKRPLMGATIAASSRNTGGSSTVSDPVSASADYSSSSEPWLGLGYNYAVALGGDISLAPGVRGGMGGSAFRLGAELPIRYRISSTMSIECAASVSHILPYGSASGGEAAFADRIDNPSSAATVPPATSFSFTSYGVQLGISIDIGSSN